MKPLLYIVLLFLAFKSPIFAQQQTNEWFFGEHCWVSFATGSPVVKDAVPITVFEGSTSVCDENGKLLFYTQGTTVYNARHEIMPNGNNDLAGGTSATQSAIILPHPGKKNIYYIFTSADRTSSSSITGFHYSTVNMDLQGGLGDVEEKNTELLKDNVSEALTATVDCSGEGFWVMTHSERDNIFYAFHITKDGVDKNPVITPFNTPNEVYFQPFLKFSPNTKLLALSTYIEPGKSRIPPALALYDFDNSTGSITYKRALMTKPSDACYGLTFSPDNSKLYVGQSDLLLNTYRDSSIAQFDVSLVTEAAIKASKVHLPKKGSAVAMQIARDGKIYITQGPYMAHIEKPNLAGRACNYQDSVLFLKGRQSNFSLSYFPDSYFQPGRRFLVCAKPISDFNTDTVCAGSTIQFQDISDNFPDLWTWHFEGGLPAEFIGEKPPPVFYEKPGSFAVTLITQNTFGSDTVVKQVLVRGLPVADAGNDVTICANGSVQLGTKAMSGNTYYWEPLQGLDNANTAQPKANPATTTQYFLTVKNEIGCESKDTVLLTVGPVEVNISPSIALCPGNSTVLKASGGAQYEWSPADGLSSTRGDTVIATPLKTTTYMLIASGGSSDNSCRDTAFVTVTIKDLLKDPAGNDATICFGQSVEIGNNSYGISTCTWTPADGLSNPNIPNPVATPLQTTTYYLFVPQQGDICEVRDSVTISVFPLPKITTRDTTLCEGQRAELFLDVENSNEQYSYSWSPVTGLNNPGVQNPVLTASSTQTYTVTVTNSGGCSTTDTITVSVNKIERIRGLLKAEKAAIEPGESTFITLRLLAQNSIKGIQSFKAAVSFDNSVFKFTPGSAVFFKGADASWQISASEVQPGELSLEASGATLLFDAEIQLEITGFLGEQTTKDIVFTFKELNGENAGDEFPCSGIETENTEILLKDVCAGDLRHVTLGAEQTALQKISPNPVTGNEISVEYSVGIEGEVKLELYNQQGILVGELANGHHSVGKYKATITIAELTSGAYLCRFTTLQMTQAVMFTIIK